MSEAHPAFGLPVSAVNALRGVLSKHHRVIRADIYGSRAKGTHRSGSDIDLTLFGEALTSTDLLRIDGEIDALDLPYRVDLSLQADIDDPALRSHIARIGQTFYRAGADEGPIP